MLRARLEVAQQSTGALGPPVRHRLLGTEHERVLGKVQGDARRPPRVAALPIETVGALAGRTDRGHVVEPRAGATQALERLGRSVIAESSLELRARLLHALRSSAA